MWLRLAEGVVKFHQWGILASLPEAPPVLWQSAYLFARKENGWLLELFRGDAPVSSNGWTPTMINSLKNMRICFGS